MIIPANSWGPSLSPPTPRGIILSIFAASFSGTACPWSFTPTVSASLAMIPWPMTVIPVPSSNAPSPLWGATHLVAPSPQAKGKIERRFGTLQKRLVALLAYEKVSSYAAAQLVLDREVQRQNATLCRTTSLSPNAAWENALAQKRTATRPCPPATLLDLHLALHLQRRVNPDSQIDFLGRSWHIAPTKRSSVTLIHHPRRQFWAVTHPPPPPLNTWPEILGNYSL